MINRKHVMYIINGAMAYSEISGNLSWCYKGKHKSLECKDYKTGSELCNLLLSENANYIYAKCGDKPYFDLVTDDNMKLSTSIYKVQLIKAIHCYQCKTHQHDGWEDSEAKKIIDTILERVICDLPGYEEAEWEIT